MPWEVSIPEAERDPGLPRKLEEELPGILAWLVQGALAWQVRGLDPPQEVNAHTEEYRAEQDVLAGFIYDRCVEGPDLSVKSDPLYVAYKEWCDLNGEQSQTQTKFAIRLKERGYEKGRNKHGKLWNGLKLRDGTDPAPDDEPGIVPGTPQSVIDTPNSSTTEETGAGLDPNFGLSTQAPNAKRELIGEKGALPGTPAPLHRMVEVTEEIDTIDLGE